MTIARALAIFCAAVLTAQRPFTIVAAQSPAPPSAQTQTALSAQQLESLVAPIALYPDPILSQVLVASTYPLEVVEAGRWVKQHPNLKGQALADAAKQQSWDASVQALVLLPDVLNRMDQNVTWTSDLGNAFLAQQDAVMNAIQVLRQKAEASGALKSTPQQTVATTTENGGNYITIEPAQPEVVYVPQYNPAAVWGPAPEYYPYPPIYYPPYSGVVAASALSFGAGLFVGAIWGGGWGGWGWNCGWGHHTVIVNNNFITRNNFTRANVGSGGAWVHNPVHRGGVPYNNPAVANRFQGANGMRPAQRPTVGQTQQRLGQGMAGHGPGNFAGRGAIGQGPGGQGAANRLGPGNMGGRGAAGTPGQGAANRMAPGNIGGRGQAMPGQGGANRIAPPQMGNRNIGGGMPNVNRGNVGGFNRGGGGFNRGGGGFRGGGGGFRGGGRRR